MKVLRLEPNEERTSNLWVLLGRARTIYNDHYYNQQSSTRKTSLSHGISRAKSRRRSYHKSAQITDSIAWAHFCSHRGCAENYDTQPEQFRLFLKYRRASVRWEIDLIADDQVSHKLHLSSTRCSGPCLRPDECRVRLRQVNFRAPQYPPIARPPAWLTFHILFGIRVPHYTWASRRACGDGLCSLRQCRHILSESLVKNILMID